MSNLAGPGLQIVKSSRGAVFADFNNDGNVDVAVAELDDSPSLLMNQGVPANHWIQLCTLENFIGQYATRFTICLVN